MRSLLLKLSLLFLCSLCACHSLRDQTATRAPAESTAPRKTAADLRTRNNSLALLDDLLNDEKDVSKILIIKRNSDELGMLVKKISKTAGEGAELLKSLAKNAAGLNLTQTGLPPGEAAARKAISKTKEQILLH